MKRILYVLPVLLALASGCLSDKATQPVPPPSGTFTGQFRRVTLKPNKTGFDTLKATIKVIIDPATGYQVLGDTATVHAGSKGKFGVSGNIIQFWDDTYSGTGPPVKNHLSGQYLYIYTGSLFQMIRNSADTLSLQYDLKKAN